MTARSPDIDGSTPGVTSGKPISKPADSLHCLNVVAMAMAALFVLVIALTAAVSSPATGAALNNSSYYDDVTVDGPGDGWYGDGNATLDQVVDMATRIPGYVIGTGEVDQSGTGFVGVLLTGLLMAGSAAGMIAGTGAGPVGGAVVALAVGFGLTSVGFAPAWIRVVLLFGVGILAALAWRRSIQQ